MNRNRWSTLSPLRWPGLSLATVLAVAGCNAPSGEGNDAASASASAAKTPEPAAVTAKQTDFAWPSSLRPFGDGYPDPGSPCRQLGESSAVANYLDHTLDLVGCPGTSDSSAVQALVAGQKAQVVDDIDGVTVLVVPRR